MSSVMNVAFPFARVGPDAVGGAEQVLSCLDTALVEGGHHSIVVACGGIASGTLLAAGQGYGSTIDERSRFETWQRHRELIEEALDRWPVDLVHLHGIDFLHYIPLADVPVLVTLHLPPSWYPPEVFRMERPHTFLHCVSDAQQRECPPCKNMLGPMPNGVPVKALSKSCHARRTFAVALGRICPEKGFDSALDAAAQADVPLFLAGEVFPYPDHQAYFRDEIEPRLDARRRFLGPIGFARKRRLLNGARCLLVPSRAPETSSLVAMEALACGTPVVALRVGALPEIVDHGRTGFLVDHVDQMAEAIRAVDTLSRQACRETAVERFSLERMTSRYLRLYEELIHSQPSRQRGPSDRLPSKEAALCAG